MSSEPNPNSAPSDGNPAARRKYVRSVGPRLRILLAFIFGLFAVLGANSVYLASITFLEWFKGLSYQNYFYMVMFGVHLVLGLLLIVPVVVFGILHARNSYDRPNRRAVRVGYSLFICALILLISGVALMRFDFFSIKNPNIRSPIYWAHVITPLLAMWLYILHRLAGPRIKWQFGIRWAAAVGVLVLASVGLHSKHPQKSQIGSKEGEKYFLPSQARTTTGKFIPAETLMMDDYCKKCHEDSYKGWFHSSHRFSSFNNPAYLFSIKETREVAMKRTGTVRVSRWCAGCHDLVPLFSGAFDDPNFDMQNHPTANAGITCTSCHSITHINSTIGNASYTIEEPIHYPFASSTNQVLQWVNNVLVKAKPEFHKKTFLKPFMKSAEYCSACHKVSLPGEVTNYKEWLRGQNHYDTHLLSGGSGHGARSFYYPPKSEPNCNGCHMPLKPSEDFGANFFNPTNQSQRHIHDHLFPSANTALPYLRGEHDVVKEHEAFGTNSVRVDIFALKDGGTIDSPIIAPLRPTVPTLKRGHKYLLEVVLRTTGRLAHHFSQGTVDSNEIWVDLLATSGTRTIARSGGLGPHGEVDEWSHFVNVYMLDKDGNRIDRRNAQDIFTPLYNNQIPPGSGQVVHYEFTVPEDLTAPLDLKVSLNYRKFDTLFVNYFMGTNHKAGDPFRISNSLPIRVISSDRISLPVESASAAPAPTPSAIPEWMRWNDYGIGLLNKGDKGSEKGELIQASYAFEQVERLDLVSELRRQQKAKQFVGRRGACARLRGIAVQRFTMRAGHLLEMDPAGDDGLPQHQTRQVAMSGAVRRRDSRARFQRHRAPRRDQRRQVRQRPQGERCRLRRLSQMPRCPSQRDRRLSRRQPRQYRRVLRRRLLQRLRRCGRSTIVHVGTPSGDGAPRRNWRFLRRGGRGRSLRGWTGLTPSIVTVPRIGGWR